MNNAMSNLKAQLAANLERAAIHLVNQVKVNLNTSGDPYVASSGPSGIFYKNENPSQAGAFPKKMVGDLQRSISYVMSDDKEKAYIGTAIDYGAWLETGTSKMQARPYLRSTLAQEQQTIGRIIATGK